MAADDALLAMKNGAAFFRREGDIEKYARDHPQCVKIYVDEEQRNGVRRIFLTSSAQGRLYIVSDTCHSTFLEYFRGGEVPSAAEEHKKFKTEENKELKKGKQQSLFNFFKK